MGKWMKFVLIILCFFFHKASIANNLNTLIKGIEKQKEVLKNRNQGIKESERNKAIEPVKSEGDRTPPESEKEVLIIESTSEKTEANFSISPLANASYTT